jgi:RNA polymerase sigma factor (sigma-70 family)
MPHRSEVRSTRAESSDLQSRLTVFVVEDDPIDRDFIALLLGRRGYPLQCFPSAESFLDAAREDWAGCVVADHRLRGMTGCDLLVEARQRGLGLPFLIVSAYGDVSIVRQVFRCGAADFLEKPIDVNQLFEQIDKALAGEPQRLELADETARRKVALEPLTEREREVAILACQGMGNREIADRLGISHRTVEAHKSRVIAKLGARTSADLVRFADLIQPAEAPSTGAGAPT